MSKAEERQRKLKRDNQQPEIFPPPVLPPFESNFDIVVNILKCDVLLHMIQLVLKRYFFYFMLFEFPDNLNLKNA